MIKRYSSHDYEERAEGWLVPHADYAALEARCRDAEALAESLQNKWASRPLSSEDQARYIADLEAALRTIVAWDSFPPATTHDGKPCSYGFAWGSNGERDYMRNIAQFALNPAPSTKETPEAMHARIVTETADAIAAQSETPVQPDRSEPDFEDWEGPWCRKCGAPVVEIPGFAPGCLRNCPAPLETKDDERPQAPMPCPGFNNGACVPGEYCGRRAGYAYPCPGQPTVKTEGKS